MAVRLKPPNEVDAGAADMTLTEERRAAVVGALKGFNLEYVPPWARLVPEECWLQTASLSDACSSEAPGKDIGV